jgi:peptidoglycan/LPS O-acetylase OafA/YrhL
MQTTAMKPEANVQHRILAIDGLRGIAAVWVMVYHFTANYDHTFGPHIGVGWSIPAGGYAVLLFFMISGYVILMTSDRAKSATDFAFARFARLYPVYWASMLITFCVVGFSGLLPERQVSLGSAAVNLTMLQSFFGVPSVDGVYWTLQIELCFYLLIGLLIALNLRKWLSAVLWVGLALTALSWFTTAFDRIPGMWRVAAYFPLIKSLPFFAIGICAYELRQRASRQYLTLLLASVLMVIASRPANELLLTAIVLALFASAFTAIGKLWSLPAVVFCGTISYSLYLIHSTIGYVIIRAGYKYGLNGNISIGIATLCGIGLACGLTFFIERPSHDWLRNWYRTKKAKVDKTVVVRQVSPALIEPTAQIVDSHEMALHENLPR